MRMLVHAAAFTLAAAGLAAAQDMSAQDFVSEAASGGMFEVQSSELALERAQGDEVKAFAQMMVTDHTANNEELKATAEAEGLSVPTEITGAAAENMETVSGTEGDAFDGVYVERQTAAHEAAIQLYERYVEAGDNEALKAYAEKSLPVLNQHLEHAQGLAAE